MKTMKKVFALLLVLALGAGIAGCTQATDAKASAGSDKLQEVLDRGVFDRGNRQHERTLAFL